MWAAIAALSVVVIAVAITIPLLLYRAASEEEVTVTTVASTTTTQRTERPTTSRTEPTEATTTTTAPAGPAGDSAGAWEEIGALALEGEPYAAAVCDDGLAVLSYVGESSQIEIYDFTSGVRETITAPEGAHIYDVDIDQNTVVWWQGTYDERSGQYFEQHIYSYTVPGGPLVNVVTGHPELAFPQIAGIWLTWVQGAPWEPDPDEYWSVPIWGAFTSTVPGSANEPQLLVPSAVTPLMGDAYWYYSLSENYLAWEQWVDEGGLKQGSYVLDLLAEKSKPLFLGPGIWRPSVSETRVVYWDEDQGLRYLDLESKERVTIDEGGDFGVAAPTFAVYFRDTEAAEGPSFEIVARGYTGAHEQVLAEQWDPPWFSAPISASGRYVAFIADDVLRVFEWKPGDDPKGPSAQKDRTPTRLTQAR